MKIKGLFTFFTLTLFQFLTAQTYELHNSINFNDVNDGRNVPDGITWFKPDALRYGIYRTSGTWDAPNYQQLKLAFRTGIVIDGGYENPKSGTVIQPNDGKVGIGIDTPSAKFEVRGNSAVYSDFASYPGKTVNGFLPNGKEPTLVISEKISGTMNWGVGGQFTYKGGLSFGRGGSGIYSVNPNPAGSSLYGDIRFHTTDWNGSDYTNFDRMVITLGGNVGIGTVSPLYKLDVCGTIRAQEVKVDLSGGCDFVFEDDYKLMDLNKLEEFVTRNKHLPEIASEKEMIANGLEMKEFQMKLLQKIEELTLYTIEQNKKLEIQNKKSEKQEKELKLMKQKIKRLESSRK
ncbi:TMF family protein [Flavobacterium tructae]|uniref:Cell wall anchor protein n=1 Tax=Flavobacterium tructae TaxID=1114873 RepID=A0A1S1JEV9_9FLAO|nr:TMF family protein [Flavobacterium tructae]OHT46773.1 hypothetical protein BHE19_04510 [Flavobacterium tructae]OXB21081.1 hypothetical protein B0A71_05690 [Flavobacterium tructae]